MAARQSSIVTRVAYGVSQLPRVAWYLGHGLALRRLAKAAPRSDGTKARRHVHTKAPVPDRTRLYADMARLFLQDLANVESGLYPLPAVMTDLCSRLLIARDCSSRISLRSIDAAKGRPTTRFSMKTRVARDHAIICRISTFNQAAG